MSSTPVRLILRRLAAAVCLSLSLSAPLLSAAADPWKTWAPRPPMGWNSYDAYHGWINEAQFKACVDKLAADYLPFGWDTAVVDWSWYNPGPADWDRTKFRTFSIDQQRNPAGTFTPVLTMDAYGRLLPALEKYPSAANGQGFKPLADYVHRQGMKFGFHIMRGIPRQAVEARLPILGSTQTADQVALKDVLCGWNNNMFGLDATQPGAQAYYDSLFALYAGWGVDFIKADDTMFPPYHAGEIEMMRKAIDKCGRPILLSLSCGEAPLGRAPHVAAHANLWRISADFWDDWNALRRSFDLLNAWSAYAAPGTWPDADMIPLGRLCLTGYPGPGGQAPDGKHREHDSFFTPDEQQTLITLWCIGRSPLMWGGDPLTSSPATKALLTNPEILAVSQQTTGNRQAFDKFNARVWIADLPGSRDYYVALFNLNDTPAEITYLPAWERRPGTNRVRDLWARADQGVVTGALKRTLPAHGSAIFRLSPE